MALRDWIGRLRGRGAETPAEEPPLTTPPGQPPAPVPPEGPPTMPPAASPAIPVPPLPPSPPPFSPPTPLGRLSESGFTPPPPLPGAEELRPQDDAGALREAEARQQAAQREAEAREAAAAPPPGHAVELRPPSEPVAIPPTQAGGGAPLPGAVAPRPTAPAAEPVPAVPAAEPAPAAPGGWFSRLKSGLARSTARLTEGVTTLFRKRRLDEAALEELEEMLITADLGVAASARIVEGFRRSRFGKEVTDEEVKAALAEEIAAILAPVAHEMEVDPRRAPHVVLVVGVNGTGKTTTIAKLGRIYRELGLTCGFVAGDTFRAAAVEQLQIWGERTGCQVHAPAKPGADAAGLAFDALRAAREAGTQVLLVDTAGRLHNKAALMEELRKIIRVLKRQDETAPHSVLLVLDATTGQNALQQVKVFKEMVAVTGLAVTKLDGSAKGGVVVALAQEFGLPVHMVGVGETAQDLRPFTARDFARGLVGLD